MTGNAAGWHEAFNELDFVIGSHPMMTSFHVEHADLMLPLKEWVEYPDISTMNSLRQMNYNFGRIPVIHLGETVSSSVAPTKVVNAASAKLNEYMANGEQIVLGAIGAVTGPNPDDKAAADEMKNSYGSTILHECDQSKFTLHFPLGIGVMNGEQEDSTEAQALADYYATQCGAEAGSLDFSELFSNYDEWRNRMDAGITEDRGWCEVSPDLFWQYDQHRAIATDGLPAGFGTESRKCEVYCSILIKMAATGFPYYYPRTLEAVDPSIGEEIRAIQPGYRFAGSYSPICQHIEPAESPLEKYPGHNPEYPLVLTSGRVNYFHHGTARHLPFARELYPAPEVRIHPATAANYNLEHLDWVEISSARGSTRGQVVLNSGMDERVIWMERFWFPEAFDDSQKTKTGGWRECNVNLLTKGTAPFNEVFGSMTYRGFAVKIAKSTKPDNIWTEPEEFRPFMPSQANVYTPDIGTTIGSEVTPMVGFTDWDPNAQTTGH
jgi:anaerobic selenocysteine-containing dehydrogenase